jgi:hypothetical protein
VVEQAAAAAPAMAVTTSARLAAVPARTEVRAASAAHPAPEGVAETMPEAEAAGTTVFLAASVAAALENPLGSHD